MPEKITAPYGSFHSPITGVVSGMGACRPRIAARSYAGGLASGLPYYSQRSPAAGGRNLKTRFSVST